MYKRVSKCLVSLLLIFFMSINTMNVYAEGQYQETLAVSEFNQAAKAASGAWFVAEISPISHRFYTIPVKYAGEIKVIITGLTKKNKVTVGLESDYKSFIDVKADNPNAIFYVRTADHYVLDILNYSDNTIQVSYTFTKKENQGGNSFSKATTLKKGVKKNGIFGFDTLVDKKQFYKFKIAKEELVKIKVTKGNSCSSKDTICVQVYKANDKKHPVTWGYIYEGQGSATLYIRNSENYRTKPGIYYVVVAKMYRDSSFNYSLTWLK